MAPRRRRRPTAQPEADVSKRRLTLLFVDDDFLISLSTAALLEDLGHDGDQGIVGSPPRSTC